jgi:NAD-dependent dihydropyrimidine dehydrogenase PreA subunit
LDSVKFDIQEQAIYCESCVDRVPVVAVRSGERNGDPCMSVLVFFRCGRCHRMCRLRVHGSCRTVFLRIITLKESSLVVETSAVLNQYYEQRGEILF